ncbi:MAG: glycosyltransferase, partial [Thermodesulfobacteriota bacterium]
MGNIDSVHTQRWAKAFTQMGYDVHVVYMGGEENNILDLKKSGISVHLLNSQVLTNSFVGYTKSAEKSSGLRNVGLHFYRRLPEWITTPLKMYLVNPRRLKKLLKEIQPDILHAWFLYDAGCMAALSGYRPLIVSSWGGDVIFTSFDHDRPLWILKWANRLTLKKADMIT